MYGPYMYVYESIYVYLWPGSWKILLYDFISIIEWFIKKYKNIFHVSGLNKDKASEQTLREHRVHMQRERVIRIKSRYDFCPIHYQR